MTVAEFRSLVASGPAKTYTMLTKATHFAESLANHVADGMRRCTAEEIKERLDVCKGCDQFSGAGCKVCGCNCSGNQQFLNKLAWASESCPIGRWGSR